MGYTTDFAGHFKLKTKLTEEHAAYLLKFSETRRMKRDTKITKSRPDPVREAVGLPVGHEGEYFVGEGGFHGQCDTHEIEEKLVAQGVSRGDAWRRAYEVLGIENYNGPPETQPGLWCQWVPSSCGNYIQWNEAEKFYCYVEWLNYIIDNFLRPWGYVLNGEVAYQGESRDDNGTIYVVNNSVTVCDGQSPLQTLAIATAVEDGEWESPDRSGLQRYWYDDEEE